MSRLALIIMTALFMLLVIPQTRAQVPEPAAVPANISALLKVDLERHRADTLSRYGVLEGNIARHNSSCTNIPTDSAQARQCEENQNGLQAEVTAYIALVETYNDAVVAAEKTTRLVASDPSPSNPNDPVNPGGAPALDVERDLFFKEWIPYGEVRLIKASTPSLASEEAIYRALAAGDKVVTGPTGSVNFTFPDGTQIELGPSSELILDAFEYLGDAGQRITLGLTTGLFKWSSPLRLFHLKRRYGVRLAEGVAVGVRGTEFEVEATPFGSGYIKLYSGELEISVYGDAPYTLYGGQMISYENFGNYGPPATLY